MRLLRLDLLAFGPFSGCTLDLSGGREGLHVVFGPNEAGKTSALRALQSLLYGIPGQTSDNFLHPYEAMRVGGRLRRRDGEELCVVRRKGSKNTLLGESGKPLPDGTLAPYLGGVSQGLFQALFGIGHETLARGADDLLAQRGDVGQALFAAGLGSTNLHAVLAGLDAEAADLFAPRAVKPRINRALSDYEEARRLVSAEGLPGSQWEEAEQQRQRILGRIAEAEEVLLALQMKRARLERLRVALPLLAERGRLRHALTQCGAAVSLPEDFPLRRRDAQERLRAAAETVGKTTRLLQDLSEEDGRLSISPALLAHAGVIQGLHRDLGGVQKAAGDRPRLQGEAAARRRETARVLASLRPDVPLERVEELRPALALRKRVQELGTRQGALAGALDAAERSARETRSKLAAVEAALANLPPRRDSSALRAVVVAAQRSGDLDAELAKVRRSCRDQEQGLTAEAARLRPAPAGPGALEALCPPAAETVDRFEQEFSGLEDRVKELGRRRDEAAAEVRECDGELEALRLAGRVPTEGELLEARHVRDSAWRSALDAWSAGRPPQEAWEPWDPSRPIAEAYAASVRVTDEVADRMRREADRVQRHASLAARKGRAEGSVEEADARAEVVRTELREVGRRWEAAWEPCGLAPLTPREMRGWASVLAGLRERRSRLAESEGQCEDLRERIGAHEAALDRETAALDVRRAQCAEGRLSDALARAEEVLLRIDEARLARDQAEARQRELRADLAAAEEEVLAAGAAHQAWQQDWVRTVGELGLREDAFPAEAVDALEGLSSVFAELREVQSLEGRVAGIDRDAEIFERRVRDACAAAAPDLASEPADRTVLELQGRLTSAGKDQARRDEYRRQLVEHRRELDQARGAFEAAAAEIVTLCREAQCEGEEGLPAAEACSARLQEVRGGLGRAERQLFEQTGFADLDALALEADGVDGDALPGRIESLGREIDDLARRVNELHEGKADAERTLRQMDGRGRAADASQRGQEILAGLRHLVEHFVRASLAARVLRDEIERYRAENQDPLVSRAAEHFGRLTRGAYRGLEVDFGNGDEPILVGVRGGGGRVTLDRMSSGARDQVYLALRLASVEKHVAEAEPLPFVVDDILIHFDDARSRATLEVLGELAAATQVIVFTHHRHVADMAASLESPAGVFVHALG